MSFYEAKILLLRQNVPLCEAQLPLTEAQLPLNEAQLPLCRAQLPLCEAQLLCREMFKYALPRHILSKNLRGEAQPQLVTACGAVAMWGPGK